MQGHLDGFLVDPNTMQSFVKKYRMQGEFEAHPLTIYSADIFIMLSKKSSDISTLNKINQAITTLTENGELSRISNSWRTLQSEDWNDIEWLNPPYGDFYCYLLKANTKGFP